MYFNPVVATVDTWHVLLEKKHLTPEREKAFLAVIEGRERRRVPQRGR